MGGYKAADGDDYSVIVSLLSEIRTRLSELETPSGTSLNSLVDQVQQAIANIETTVNTAILTNSYTKSQIDTKIADKAAHPGDIEPTSVTSSGPVSGASLTTTGDVQVGGQARVPDAVGYVITGVRRAVWVEDSTGRLGNTSSSRRFKQDIRSADIDIDAFLSVESFWFRYIAEVRKRDDPAFAEYIGPDYLVPEEYGLMAEDLDAAGLNYWVYYDADGLPEGVNYTMLVVPLLSAVRHLRDQIAAEREARLDLEARITALETKGS